MVEPDGAGVQCRQGGRHGRARGLHHHRHHDAEADQGELPHEGVAGQHRGVEPVTEDRHGGLQVVDADEDQAEAGEGEPGRPGPAATEQVGQRPGADHRQGEGGNRDLEAEQRDQPAGAGGAQVGAEDHPHGLLEAEDAGADETDGRHGGRRRRLDQGGDGGAGEQGRHPAAGEAGQGPPERVAGDRLEPVGHQDHAEQEQPDPTQ